MPIFEYACDGCGTRFEQLVRRTSETPDVRCPECGHDRLSPQYSTFSARSGAATRKADPPCGEGGGCGAGMCGGGMCGMN